MTTHRKRLLVALAAVTLVAAQVGVVLAQQAQPRKPPPPKPPQTQQSGKNYYEMYEPSKRQRLRREACGRDELSQGVYCFRECRKGYVLVAGTSPPRCRSTAPLPAGQLPGPVRQEIGAPPRPPRKPVPQSQPRTGPRPA
jgi:hypothetical protein